MPVETFNYLDSLNVNNPPTSDGIVGGDDHIRGIKATLKNTFPNVAGAVTGTHTQLNTLTGGLDTGGTTLRLPGACPPGAIMDFGGPTAPAGWFTCDGQAVSRTTYADLYAAIGTTWGAGDGSTTFNLPSLATRFRRHRDNNPALAGVVGTLKSPANMAHIHGVNGVTGLENQAHNHNVQGVTFDDSPDHTHGFTYTAPNGNSTSGGGSFFVGGPITTLGGGTGGASTRHQHGFNVTSGTEQQNHNHNVNINSGGGTADDPNEARPYSAAVLTCIKT